MKIKNERREQFINMNKYYSIQIQNSFPIDIFKYKNKGDLEEIKCKYCYKIPLNPKIYRENNNRSTKKILCTECNNRVKYQLIEFKYDKITSEKLKKELGYCKVKCPNKCKWEGIFQNLIAHLKDDCKLQSMKCLKKNCGATFERKDLGKHLNECGNNSLKIICEICHQEIEKNDNNHINICKEEFIDCPYNCGIKVKRANLIYHKKDCPEYEIKCKYHKFGCKMNIKNKDKKEHNKKKIYNHLKIIELKFKNMIDKNDEYYETKKIIEELKKEINKIEKENIEKIKLKEENNEDSDLKEWNNLVLDDNSNKITLDEKRDKDEFFSPIIKMNFCADDYIIQHQIIIFEHNIIKYSGAHYYNFGDNNKKHFVFVSDCLDLNEHSNFEFRIEKVNYKLPWIAIGVCINENYISEEDKFPRGFYCMDINSNIYYNGIIENAEENEDKLNLNTFITICYFPEKKNLIIYDNSDFKITFPDIPNDNPNIRLCFIFEGNDKAIIYFFP